MPLVDLLNALLWAGRKGLPPIPDTWHLGCSYHLHSSHCFLSTWGVGVQLCWKKKKKKKKKRRIIIDNRVVTYVVYNIYGIIHFRIFIMDVPTALHDIAQRFLSLVDSGEELSAAAPAAPVGGERTHASKSNGSPALITAV